MGSVQTNVSGSTGSNAVSYTFSNVSVGQLIDNSTFAALGVKINQERVRRGRGADATIKDAADYSGVVNYAELEKLRTAINVGPASGVPTFSGRSDGALITFSSGTNTAPTFTGGSTGNAAFPTNPGQISASGNWTGFPKITAALFNSIVAGLKSQGNECICNCNYCTCNCNYCTCNCNFACTCNCNYSDVTTKENIVYM
jgi:hypothetical protein